MSATLRLLRHVNAQRSAPLGLELQERERGFWPDPESDRHTLILRVDSVGNVHKHSNRDADGAFFADSSTLIPKDLATSWRVGVACVSLAFAFETNALATLARKHGVELDANPRPATIRWYVPRARCSRLS
jgi:hypothetical protein